jgi:hypothetical protein
MGSNPTGDTMLLAFFRVHVLRVFFLLGVEWTDSVVWWSEFLVTDPGGPGSIPGTTRFSGEKKGKLVVGVERDPLSFVSTTEELLDRNVAAPV